MQGRAQSTYGVWYAALSSMPSRRDQRRHRGLTDGHQVDARPHDLEKRLDRVDEVVEAEARRHRERDVPRIQPVGQIHVVVREEGPHRIS